MNPVLARQLRRLGLDPETPPDDPEQWAALLARVNTFYDNADQGRYILERSLDLSSREMQTHYEQLKTTARSRVELSEIHYRNIFMHSPIAMWEEDFSEVAAWLGAVKESGVRDLEAHFEKHPSDLAHALSLIIVRDANHAAAELFEGDSREQLLGPLDPDAIADKRAAAGELLALWNGDGRHDREMVGQTFKGNRIDGILHWRAPMLGVKRDLTRVLVAIADITERKAAEERMAELIRSKDQFLAAVSHELRTPLTTVYGAAESLQEQWVELPDEIKRELLDLIAGESRDLAHLIEDLLVAARADIGTIVVRRMPIEIGAEVDMVLEAIALEADIEIDSTRVEGWAIADPLRFRQILRNLVMNAIRYGGHIIRIETRTTLEGAFMYVWDNGDGIPPARREAVFEPYKRAHNTAGLPGSVGLGLSVARQLAQLMAGDLTYDYQTGWSVFTLRLPLHLDVGEVA
jgi:signal transduction histidine kinase